MNDTNNTYTAGRISNPTGPGPLDVGVLFDSAMVADQDWAKFVGGSFFERVPAGADGYILSFVLHDWDDERATAILRNVRQAMSPEGRVLVVEGLIPEGDEPALSKLSDLEMLVMTSGGRERTVEEFRELFAAAGLRLTRVVPMAGAAFVLEAST